MSDQDPTFQDLWRLLGSMNRRMNERFDAVERQLVAMNERISGVDAQLDSRMTALESSMAAKFGALKESIEARDFRLDEHGRRLSKLEESLP